jgi:DNA invertase Pin-like site-specific DNA recombinase
MKCALYCRLSEEDRNKQCETDDSNSIQNQKSMLIQYALDNNWEVFDIYSDDDYTGSDRNRPQFNKLLVDAENKKFDVIICKSQSRFTRELEMVEKYIHGLFLNWGIRFIGLVDNADTEIKGNKKSRQINGLVNEWYLEDMSENIKSVLTNRRENGFHIGAFALYGYQKDPNKKGHLIIDDEAAEVVREVFKLFVKGYGKTAIARILNERGIPNPTEYKRIKGLRWRQPKSQNATLWKYHAITDMLSNEMYIGHMVQGKYGSISYKSKINKPKPKEQWIRVKNTHEPIIDKELWNHVQQLIQQKTKPFKVGKIGIFAKKAICINCGYTMRSTKSHDKYYLKCSTRHTSKEACMGSFVAVKDLESSITEELQQLCITMLNKDMIVKSVTIESDNLSKIEMTKKCIRDYENKILLVDKALKNLNIDKVQEVITNDDYIQLTKDFHKDKQIYQKTIANYKKQLIILDEKIKHREDKEKITQQYTNVTGLTREIVEVLIDKIYIGKRNTETKELPIDIHWNF